MFHRMPCRAATLLVPLLSMAAIGADRARGEIRLTGVNLSVAEFGQTSLPGTFNTHYRYPSTAEIDYYTGQGMNTFRLPFRWERLQQSQHAPFDAAELDRLDTFVGAATAGGAHVIVDPHNFGRYYPQPAGDFQGSSVGVVGADVPNSALADFWARMADEYKDNHRVIFNLMNEPANMPTEQWFGAAQAAIDAIRDTGATNLILVPGNGYSGAHSWHDSYYGTPNADVMLDIDDPLDNFAYDVHQYLDHNSSGTSNQIGTDQNPDNTNIGVERLTEMTDWLRDNDRKAFLGEFAVANSRIGDGAGSDGPQIGDEAIDNMLHYMRANEDVWLGWAWWAGGPWWNEYRFTIEPTNLGQPNETDRPAMDLLQPHLATVLEGDYNFDGVVDAADYTVWRDSLGQTGAALAADADLNGSVGPDDYAAWKANFAAVLATGSGPLPGHPAPEPGAFLLAASASLLVTGRLQGVRVRRR